MQNEQEQKKKTKETKVLKFEEIKLRMPSLEQLLAVAKQATKKQKTNIGL